MTIADSESNGAVVERNRAQSDDLPSLMERLAADLAKLLDQKLTLLKVELKEEVNDYVRGSLLILSGGLLAAVGFALANIALAFAVTTFFVHMNMSQPAKYALGFVVTGAAYLVIGAVVIIIIKNRLAKRGIVPKRTMNELERDKEWLQKEL